MRSDVEDLMPRLLPIETENRTEALKLNGAPRNPQEYLRQVQLEASLCPEVVVAQIDPKKLRKKQTVNAFVSGCQAAPEGFSPSLGWQQQQVANFSDVRQSFAKHRRHWSTQSLDENVVMTMEDCELIKRYRLNREGIKLVVELVRDAITSPTNRNNPISPEIKCLATLRYLATGKMQLCNADDLGISQPSVSRAINQTINTLCMPGVVGAIDGTHIKIIAPSKDEDVFVNRKKVHSINTQIVFDATFHIIDVVAKWPGSTHDSRILMGSGLRQDVALDTLSQSTTGSTVKPKLADEEGWKMFCLGETVYKATAASETDPNPSSALDYSKVMGFPPFLSIVSRLNQTTVLAVLEILAGWFEEGELVPQLGRWLYALLACLEKPLIPEAHSLIRQLARRCGQLRTTLQSQEDERLPVLNLLICLVAR
ncbi:Gem-associated protein 2 [Merluccius polli]|uniref:Gem-associated protein 2 n=1 Tax=Merluccius polli TaxID=89951 RepID=A0AA47N4W8_MERPO|nr:Gem-associated protein 2 [Merluccius polli]